MMVSIKSLLSACLLVASTCASIINVERSPAPLDSRTQQAKQITTYPKPTTLANNTAFAVQVKIPGGRWTPLDVYLVNLSLINTTTGSSATQKSSMAYFDFSGTIEVSVTYNTSIVNNATIRPYSLNIPVKISHKTVSFTLTQPENLIVQVNDNIFDVLHLLSAPLETDVPSENSTDVIYFGPGVHDVPGNILQVPSGKTVYLAGGAVLTATVNFSRVHDARLTGRGVIQSKSGGAIIAEYSKNITIDGAITALNPNGYAALTGEVDGLVISGLRAFSNKGNGDGIDIFCSQNALVDGVFMRNSDDTIALYQHRWDYYGNSSNLTVQNSRLWADVAHPINIGTHGNTDNPETMDGVTIRNIDVMDHREPQMDYQGTLAINVGDSNMIQNVHVEDLRVENFREGQLINMRVMFNTKYNTSPGRGIRNVTIKNLSYNGTNANPSILDGYDSERTISFVTFKNLVINGKQIADSMRKPTWYETSDFVPMFANDNVQNLTFLAS
ncbi:endo-polygalacturonase [Leptodontidium sp. MPI-SDFR-AT-0119]|nr:endo-polygalacturonase [Leptodontidium sp. MPI-SDFR-AT-0119]